MVKVRSLCFLVVFLSAINCGPEESNHHEFVEGDSLTIQQSMPPVEKLKATPSEGA